MRTRALLLLATLAAACGGESTGNGPSDANVIGTWIVTFSSTTNCNLSQIAFVLSEGQSGAPQGTYGSYFIACAASPDDPHIPGTVQGWGISGNRFSLQVTNLPSRILTGTVNGGTMSGTFTWLNMSGTFTAVKQ